MKLRALLILALLSCALVRPRARHIFAADSVVEAKRYDNTHEFKVKQLVVPAAMIGIGLFAKHNGWLSKLDNSVQDGLRGDRHKRIKVDEYTLYAPIVGAYALDVLGVRGQHNYKDLTIISAMSYAIMLTLTQSTKHIFKECRPDRSSRSSFPSGHTANAFTGATILWEEYKGVSPWIGVVGYAVATGTGFLRMYNNKHYLRDVVAGAGMGILSARLAYWLYPVIFHHDTGKKTYATHIVGAPYIGDNQAGCTAFITF